jgi:hypothetical protein
MSNYQIILVEIATMLCIATVIAGAQKSVMRHVDLMSPGLRALHLMVSLAIVLLPLWAPWALVPAPEQSVFGAFSVYGWTSVLGIGAMTGMAKS